MNVSEFIFETYKDNTVKSIPFRREMKKRFGLSDKSITNLIVKITNYQIKTYGTNLYEPNEKLTKEDWEKINVKAKERKYRRMRRKGKCT